MNTLETIKKLYAKFPNLTVKELIDILECLDLKDYMVYNLPHLKDIGKFKSEDIFCKNY